jgi:hypothetical protein
MSPITNSSVATDPIWYRKLSGIYLSFICGLALFVLISERFHTRQLSAFQKFQ